MSKENPIIVAITAASGVIYGVKVLEFLIKNHYKVELIISSKAFYIFKHELNIELSQNKDEMHKEILNYLQITDNRENLHVWLDDELWANPSSGSYKTCGMIIAPASMATIAAIASGHAETLIARAADVCLKERRPVTVVPRETPLNSIHLENMLKLSKLGINIVMPTPGFYGKPQTINDIINFVVGKILDASNIDNNLYERWQS